MKPHVSPTTRSGGSSHNQQSHMTITDKAVLEEYNARPYKHVEHRLKNIRDHLLDAPRDVVATAIHLSTVNSIISTSTHVKAHERGAIAAWEHLQAGNTSKEALAEALDLRSQNGKHAIMYYNNKAEYIQDNLIEVDYDALAKLYQNELWFELQGEMARNVTGLQNVKAAFTMANLGVTEAACMDRIMHSAFEVGDHARFDAKDPFGTAVVDRYYERVEKLRAETPRSAEKLDRYIWQWAAWAAHRDAGFTMHDPWFLLLDTVLDIDVFTPDREPEKELASI